MSLVRTLRVATRTSALALIQTRSIVERLAKRGIACEIVEITTRGDRDKDGSLAVIGGDGVFVKELQNALLDNRADIAVHSMKDLPTELPPGVRAGVVPPRADARDALVSPRGAFKTIRDLPQGAVIGTSSLRRKAQLLVIRPDLRVRDLRGNVDTRIKKMLAGACDAAVLAMAGIERIGLPAEAGALPVAIDEMVPAVGQGALYVQHREADSALREMLAPLDDPASAFEVDLERAFLKRMGGGCLVPIGGHAQVGEEGWTFHAFVAEVDGTQAQRRSIRGSDKAARSRVEALADEMLAAGAREIIAKFRT
ncbi:MAG TPA: hydroxymethylbilane synthase [Candidatus Tumulicola sp.]|nr:hydroxymethylbilane synthase [Candidatus Tumulicola sp.]